MTPENVLPVELEDEDEGTPELQDLTEEFTAKLYAAGFLNDDEVDVEKFMMRLDSLVCNMPKVRKKTT